MARSKARENVEKLRNIVAASNFMSGDWDPDTETGTNDRDGMADLYAFCALNKCELIDASADHYLIDGDAVQVTAPIAWLGKGFRDLDNERTTACPDAGTWLIHGPNSSGSMFEIKNNKAKRCAFVDTAIFQMGHDEPAPGWEPADRDWIFDCSNTQGGVRFERVHFHNVARGINFDYCVRPEFSQITGQFFIRGVSMDRVFDIGRCHGLRAWTYWSEAYDVLAYTQAESITLTLLRVDGLWLDELFSFGTLQALYCGAGASATVSEQGSARAIFIGGIYADFCGRAVVADTTNVELQIGAIFHLGQAWPVTPVASLPGACAIDIASGSNSLIQVGHVRSNIADASAIKNSGAGTGNRIWITTAIGQNYDYAEAGAGYVDVLAGNAVNFSVPPLHTNKLAASVLTASASGEVAVSVEQIHVANSKNIVRAIAAAAGNPAFLYPSGEADAGIAIYADNVGGVTVAKAGNKIGFYGAAPVVKPTGVAANAAAILAALTTLGLMS